MAEKVSAKKFFEDFNKITLHTNAVKLYQDNKAFTVFVTDQIRDIINSYDFKSEQEYYRIDVIGYKSHYDDVKKKNNVHISPYAWDLKIAVEHENNDKLWMDEVVKLAHIYCDLHVVIGYLPMNKRTKGEDKKCLDYVVDILKHCDCYKNLKDDSKEFMVIIGNSNTNKNRPETFFNYKGYVFNSKTETFEMI